jgi:hypothetical protein
VLGEAHPDTLMSANNLAMSLADQRKHAEAEEMLQAALEVSRRVLGGDGDKRGERGLCPSSVERRISADGKEKPRHAS